MNFDQATAWKLNRRDCLGGLGLGSVALAGLLAEQDAAAATSPLKPKETHHAPRAKNVIFLFMVGGVSHIESFDNKPLLKKYAGKNATELFSKEELDGLNPEKDYSKSKVLQPVFSFKQHGECGMWVSEIFPHLTNVVDDITMINSMRAASSIHSVGQISMHTGYLRPGYPSMGAWVTYGLGSENRNMPGFVALRDGVSSAGPFMYQSGFLPSTYQATVIDTSSGDFQLDHLKRVKGVSAQQQRRQLELMSKLNSLHREKHKSQGELDARINSFETAFYMQGAAPELFDIGQESASVRKLYGDTPFGKQCLTARRLVENGVRFVEIFNGSQGRRWDAHGNRGGLIDNHRGNAAKTDQGIAALIMDLKSRGLLDETLVVWATEFGRTPFEEANREKRIGRGHHHYGFSMWMAGGGVKRGLTYGATDDFGMHAVDSEVSHHDFHATILHLLGLDHKQLTYRHNGRDFRITDVHGNVVHDIIA
ncbi:MAG: sulfatase [Planctomycetaceae bacterium]|nr:sulfatase [Planctomycetaceae bacterium]